MIFMKPGYGYWIKADENYEWNLNAITEYGSGNR